MTLSRRGLLRAGAAVAATVAGGGATGAGVAWTGVTQRRERAFAAARRRTMPTSVRVLWRVATEEPVLALTFDDGPDPELTRSLLDALAEHDATATFFVCGAAAERHPDLVREAADRHEVGNHTWGHVDLSALDRAGARVELARTGDLVEELTGQRPRVLRPPWGRLSGVALHAAAEQQLDVLLWDVRFVDGHGESARSPADNAEHVLRSVGPGSVVLGHDAGLASRTVGVAAVPQVLRTARERGYRFVTASEALALDAR